RGGTDVVPGGDEQGVRVLLPEGVHRTGEHRTAGRLTTGLDAPVEVVDGQQVQVHGRRLRLRHVDADQDRVVVRGAEHRARGEQVGVEVVVPGVLVQHRLHRVDVPHVHPGDPVGGGGVGEHVVQGADRTVVDVGGLTVVEV